MQRLIELTEDHYIIVDDSKIKEGDWYAFYCQGEVSIFKADDIFDDRNNPNIIDDRGFVLPYWNKKITHSTKPIEHVIIGDKEGFIFDKVQYLSLSEVKSLIGKIDIEELAEQYAKAHSIYESSQDDVAYGFREGYNQCLEDSKDKKYTIDDLRKAFNAGDSGDGGAITVRVRKYNGFDNYLENELGYKWDDEDGYIEPKIIEWEVVFENGKLRLV